MAQYSREYFNEKQRLNRLKAKVIYTYHAYEKHEYESDKEFRRRFSKRIIVINEDEILIFNPFGKLEKVITKRDLS